MTWGHYILLASTVMLLLTVADDWRINRKQRIHINRLEANNATMLHILGTRHPSSSEYLTTDEVMAYMEHCLTCTGLRDPNHFVYHPTHVKL